ncbi:MAG: hypothetical protein Q7O66_07370 [Dehalococcoidia bacterium]|nr:hypothetical protein [Dehalococcoidia bacterium]
MAKVKDVGETLANVPDPITAILGDRQLPDPLGDLGRFMATPTRKTTGLTSEETALAYQTGELPPGAYWTDSGPMLDQPRDLPRGEDLMTILNYPLVQAAFAGVPQRGPSVVKGIKAAREVADTAGEAIAPKVTQLVTEEAGAIGGKGPSARLTKKLANQPGLEGIGPTEVQPEMLPEYGGKGGVVPLIEPDVIAAKAETSRLKGLGQTEMTIPPETVPPPVDIASTPPLAPVVRPSGPSEALTKFFGEIDGEIKRARLKAGYLRRGGASATDITAAEGKVNDLQQLRKDTILMELPDDVRAKYEAALAVRESPIGIGTQASTMARSNDPAYRFRGILDIAKKKEFEGSPDIADPRFRQMVFNRYGQSLDEIAAHVSPGGYSESLGEEWLLDHLRQLMAKPTGPIANQYGQQLKDANAFIKDVESGKLSTGPTVPLEEDIRRRTEDAYTRYRRGAEEDFRKAIEETRRKYPDLGHEEPPVETASRPVDSIQPPSVVYHGTSNVFESFDPGKQATDALYGPGAYFTEDPNIASGYAKTTAGRASVGGASNIHPVHLSVNKAFNIDAPVDKGLIANANVFLEPLGESVDVAGTNGDLYRQLLPGMGNKAELNDWLSANGYDAITHMGGVRRGVPHRVWIALGRDTPIPGTSTTSPSLEAQITPVFGRGSPESAGAGGVPPIKPPTATGAPMSSGDITGPSGPQLPLSQIDQGPRGPIPGGPVYDPLRAGNVPPVGAAPPGGTQPPIEGSPGGPPGPGPISPDNILGLRPITPFLTRAQEIANVVRGMFSKVIPIAKEHPAAFAALQERSRVRPVISSMATRIGALSDHAATAFAPNAQGLVENLIGIDPRLPNAPTIQDIAARLPVFESSLTPAQRESLSLLRNALDGYETLLRRLGVKFGTRADVMEGGFYLPRGRADAEGVDMPLKVHAGKPRTARVGFQKPADFESQSSGIAADFEYPPLKDAVTSFAKDAGRKALDAHIARYFKELQTPTGGLVGEVIKGDEAAGRGYAQIKLPDLESWSFPDEIANSVNKYIRNEGPAQGWGSGTLRTVNAFATLYRNMRATADNSAVGIQGLLAAASDQKAWMSGFKLDLEAWGRDGDKVLGRFIKDYDAKAVAVGRPTSDMWARAGLQLGGAETEFSLGPGFGRLGGLPGIKQANRAFGFFGDSVRLDWADHLAEGEMKGRTVEEFIQSGGADRVAEIANNMTGWARGKAFGSMGDLLLFAPKFLQARVESVLKGVAGMRPGAPLEQRIARNSLLKLIGTGTVLTVALNRLQGQDTDFRPMVDGKWNANFMRIRWGGRDWSLFGTYDSLARAMVLTATGKPQEALRSLGSGPVTVGWDLIGGKSFTGGPTRNSPQEFATYLLTQMVPFAWQDVPFAAGKFAEAVNSQAIGPAVSGLGTLVGATIGAKSTPLSKADQLDQVTKASGYPNLSWDDLTASQQKALRAKSLGVQQIEKDAATRNKGSVPDLNSMVADQRDAGKEVYDRLPESARKLIDQVDWYLSVDRSLTLKNDQRYFLNDKRWQVYKELVALNLATKLARVQPLGPSATPLLVANRLKTVKDAISDAKNSAEKVTAMSMAQVENWKSPTIGRPLPTSPTPSSSSAPPWRLAAP